MGGRSEEEQCKISRRILIRAKVTTHHTQTLLSRTRNHLRL